MSNVDNTPNQQIYQNAANILSQVNSITEFSSETPNSVGTLSSIVSNTCDLAKSLLSKESYRSFIIQQKTQLDQLLSDMSFEDEILDDEESWDETSDDVMYDDDEFEDYQDEFDEES